MKTSPPIVALVLLTCGCGNRETIPVSHHSAVALTNGFVELRLEGMIANLKPEGYRPSIPWVPMDVAATEGSPVNQGDELVKFNRERIARLAGQEDFYVRHRTADVKVLDARAARDIARYEEDRMDLERTHKVLNSAIEATLRKDEAEIAIAETKIALANHEVEQARLRLERLEYLNQQKVDVYRELLDARDTHNKALEALRVPTEKLDQIRNATFATPLRLLELERGAVEIDLGSPEHEHGVFGRIKSRRKRAYVETASLNQDKRERKIRHDRLRNMAEDGALRAKSKGVIRHREEGLNTGDWLNHGAAVFVLKEEDMGFALELPAHWRNVIDVASPEHTEAGRVFVDIPQLGYRRLRGRFHSIAFRPYRTRIGQAYRCLVSLEESVDGLLEGLRVDCSVHVIVPRSAIAIPSWTVSDPYDPEVTMADGSIRSIVGFRVGHRFIVTKGIGVGERVSAIPQRELIQPFRLTGLVEPREWLNIRVPWHVEILDMLPEGSAVDKGDVIAHLIFTRAKSSDSQHEADFDEDFAAKGLELAQIDEESALSMTYADWRKQLLKVKTARLHYMVERYAGSVGRAEAHMQREHAAISLSAARRRLAETEEAALAGTRSLQEVRDARLEAETSQLTLEKAKLKAVSVSRLRDWMLVWKKQAAFFDAEDKAADLRNTYSLKRKQFYLAIARAADRYRMEMEKVLNLRREVERLVVKAPQSGHVYYHFDRKNTSYQQRPLKAGRELKTTAPFLLSVNRGRRVRFEVPERFRDRFKVGQEVELRALALGTETVKGTVADISYHIHEREAVDDEHMLSGTIGAETRVFTAWIDLELTARQTDRIKPGVTVWMEVTS